MFLALVLSLVNPPSALAAVTSSVDVDGMLMVTSDAGDQIKIWCSDGKLWINGFPPDTGEADCSTITVIRVVGGPGNNNINLSGVTVGDFPNLTWVQIHGEDGNDVLDFDAKGLLAVDDGATIAVEGYEPVSYSNFENVVITNTAMLSRIELIPAEVNLELGRQQQFAATAYDSAGHVLALTPIWSTGQEAVSSGGLYTAASEGDFTVTASVNGSSIIGTARVHVGPDDDADGLRNVVEDNAPNNGDGNGDGVPDSQQANVTSLLAATGQGSITIETTCPENQDLWAYKEAWQGHDPNYLKC